jgi:HlyD family secretion protein
LNSTYQKLIYYVKKTIYILIGGAVVIIAGLIILSKSIGNKDKGTEIEIAQVNPITIVGFQRQEKIQPEIEVKFHLKFRERLFFECVRSQVVKRRFTSKDKS